MRIKIIQMQALGPAMMHQPRAATILVVDDNTASRYSTARFLKAAGFATLEAVTGTEAIELAQTDPDAVVLDVNLPDMDGFEVCKALRARAKTARIPIIHLSATFVGASDKARGLEMGADGYLTHPVEPPVLIATIRAFLRARDAEEGMRRSEERFRAIFDQAINGISLLSRDLVYVEVNTAMCQMLGRNREEIVGYSSSDFVPPDSLNKLAEISRELDMAGVWRGTFPLVRSDGRLIELEWNISIHSEPGVRLAVVTDITERRLAEIERDRLLSSERSARSEAERANHLKDEFLATLSHELRTPLNAIVGWSQLLKRRGSADIADYRDGIEAIERNAMVQAQLINDLLDVARITSGKLRLELQSIDAVQVMRNAIVALMPSAAAKGVTIKQEIDEESGLISADPARLQQVIWNLISNSVKFTPKGGEICVRLKRTDSSIELIVSDNGEGIRPEFLPHIFETFRQEDGATTRYHEGLGLGLAIVKRLVEMHGGNVTAHSPGEGKGSSFVVQLPPRGVSSSEIDAMSLARNKQSPDKALVQGALKGVQVLLVEDDEDARSIIRRVVSECLGTILEAPSVSCALALLESDRPDILLSDIGMPGEDGYDLIRQVRARGFGAECLPAIALTAYARPDDEKRLLASGFQAHLTKPVDVEKLVATIARLAARREREANEPIE